MSYENASTSATYDMQTNNFREANMLANKLKLCTFDHSLVAQPGMEGMSRKERQFAMVGLAKAFVEIPFDIKLQNTRCSVGEAMKQGCHCTMSSDETSSLVEALIISLWISTCDCIAVYRCQI